MIKVRCYWKRFRCIGLVLACVMGMLGVLLLTACDTESAQAQISAYQANVKTSDGLFLIQFRVTPNRQGANTFVVVPTTSSGAKPASTMRVHLDTTMLDMDMGTDVFDLQASKNGAYSGQAYLTMAGNWQIRIELFTSDGKLHEASVKFATRS